MKKMTVAVTALGMTALTVSAQVRDTVRIERMDCGITAILRNPAMIDSVDVNGKGYDASALIDMNRHARPGKTSVVNAGAVLGAGHGDVKGDVMGRLSVQADVHKFIKGVGIIVPRGARAYVDGKPFDGEVNLKPGSYVIDVDWTSTRRQQPKADVRLVIPRGAQQYINVTPVSEAGGRMACLGDFMDGTHASQISLSPSGKYLLTDYSRVAAGGKQRDRSCRIFRTQDITPISGMMHEQLSWMPRTDALWGKRTGDDGTAIVYTLDPLTNSERVLAKGLPEGDIAIAPTEDFAILTTIIEGPKEDAQIYQILEPEDRQPGWRTRTQLWRADFADGTLTPLTFGHRPVTLNDIAADGSKILVTTQRTRYTQRPTTIHDVLVIDLGSLQVDTVVSGDGFVNSAIFSPDASKVLINGTPEALGGVARNLPAGRTPSMTESELFVVSLADGKIDPITKDFDPSVNTAVWNSADGKIYLIAQDRDREPLFVYDPARRTFKDLSAGHEDMVQAVAVPRTGNTVAWKGASASNSERVYLTDTRKGTTRPVDDPSRQRLEGLRLGKVLPFDYVTSRGDSIFARYYLPADFDPAKKYPVIVNYYGGCSPIGRDFESRYPQHLYAAQGYVMLVINPSGCTGRGQEWASRHVNTAGEGVAQDIIEGTQQFCRTFQWADSTALGCIGASYGGFMTQYLQTQTDMFAAAISHAGISDHTSYWGEGYWGYSYSEVAMANSYPWTRKDLYVDHSPLYLADRITTPLLFLHGDSDHNVPVGESIQMYTALKLLGRPTAFVAVAGQDHHILDYDKRNKWQDTIFAWFEKYLKHDSTWWDTLYPPKFL